ncbi:hypothetical protein CKAN_00920100 [Cinnamomum micranthum f. kanehirae]|uniref:Uncharacterized protein n=1 Tax=Cinnamomum micranthum f. kanehirae TaxID=337451 RepID=A0A443NPX2_9MAGN|nr:hypothetical protein CKAN_00920100 [Cinnamomum micranthum f. kanehirae]
MRHQQLQKHEDLALQMLLLCTVPSCGYHTDEAVFEMDLLQSKYYRCSYADCEAYAMERIRLCAEYIVHKKDRCFAGCRMWQSPGSEFFTSSSSTRLQDRSGDPSQVTGTEDQVWERTELLGFSGFL